MKQLKIHLSSSKIARRIYRKLQIRKVTLIYINFSLFFFFFFFFFFFCTKFIYIDKIHNRLSEQPKPQYLI